MKFRFLPFILSLILGCLASPGLDAAELGPIIILSKPGQPFLAEVELAGLARDELTTLKVNLAKPSEYQQSSLSFNAETLSIKTKIAAFPQKPTKLVLFSAQPLKSEYLDILLKLRSSTGQTERAYSFYINRPQASKSSSSAVVTSAENLTVTNSNLNTENPNPIVPEAMTSGQAQARDSTASSSTVANSSGSLAIKDKAALENQSLDPIALAVSQVEATAATKSSEIQVKGGDTLLNIARQVKPRQVTIEQTMLGLFRANPSAFENKNINLLQVDTQLRVPTVKEFKSINSQQANQFVKKQVKLFFKANPKASRPKPNNLNAQHISVSNPRLSTPVNTLALAERNQPDNNKQKVHGSIARQKNRQEALKPSAENDQLKLSRAASEKAQNNQVQTSKEINQVAKPTNADITPVSKTASSSEPSSVNSSASSVNESKQAEPASSTALQAEKDRLAEEALIREKALKETQARIDAVEKNIKDIQRLLQTHSTALAQLENQLKQLKQKPQQLNGLSNGLRNGVYLWIAAIGVILLLALSTLLLWKSRRSLRSKNAPNKILSTVELAAQTQRDEPSLKESLDTSLTETALTESPIRTQADQDPDDTSFSKILDQSLEQTEPEPHSLQPVASNFESDATLDLSDLQNVDQEQFEKTSLNLDVATAQTSEQNALDKPLEEATRLPPLNIDLSSIDLNLDDAAIPTTKPFSKPVETADRSAGGESFAGALSDKNFDPETKDDQSQQVSADVSPVSPEFNANLPTSLSGFDVAEPLPDISADQEILTKLDLAAAYIEIGDQEGARDLLDEVIKLGNSEQKNRARELLAQLR